MNLYDTINFENIPDQLKLAYFKEVSKPVSILRKLSKVFNLKVCMLTVLIIHTNVVSEKASCTTMSSCHDRHIMTLY